MNNKLIYEHLKEMGQGQDLEVLRNFSQSLGEVVEYNNQRLSELARRIDEEVKDPAQRFYVYGTGAAKKEAPLVNHFLFPMEDQEECGVTVFLPWSQERIAALCREKQQVILELQGERQEETLWLRPVKRYFQKMEELKNQFYENGVFYFNWNLPYLYKFFELVREGETEPIGGPVTGVWIKGREKPLKIGMVPYWNVKRLELPCTVFPIPSRDQAYFEHILEMPDPVDGYLVSGQQEISQVLYRGPYIVIRTKRSEAKKWVVYQIVSPKKKEISIPHLSFTTNQREMTHTDRQAEQAVRLPRTRKEITRILRSYQVSGTIQAREITLLDRLPEGLVTGEELWDDNLEAFENKEEKKCIQIRFHVEKPDFITREQIAFLMRELGTYFPEYKFGGYLE